MTKSIVVAVFLAAMLGCAARRESSSKPTPRTAYGVMLIGRSQVAQGCPVGQTTMLTARHVAVSDRFQKPEPRPAMWSDDGGRTGRVGPTRIDHGRDLAVMTSDRPFRHWYVPAAQAPKIGQEVEIRGYDFGRAMQPDRVTVNVDNIVAGHLVLSPGGEPGFSGSCVIDEAGHAVGVFVGAISRPDGQNIGLAVGVWGEWSPLKETQ